MNNKIKVLFYLQDFDDEPLGILYISSILKNIGVMVDIVLTKYEDYKQKTLEFKPDFAAFTVTTGYDKYYIALAKELKGLMPSIKTIFGGPHCTFFPEFIETSENIDFVFRGETENAIIEFINKYRNSEDLSNINNLYCRINGVIYKNDVGNLVNDIDTIPQPDRLLLTKYKFYRESSKKNFITGRGCPFNCSYCFNHAFNKMYKAKGKIIRRHSVDYTIEQINIIKNNCRLEFIQFVDDIFIISNDWLEEFKDKYPRLIKIPFNCNVRVDYVNEKTITLLKQAGCHSVSMGIEAGNEYIRNNILKRNLKDDEIINACKIIKSAGLKLATQNIVGIPGGALENDFETMRLNNKCKTDYAWCTIYQPYPGIKLTDIAISLGLFDGNRETISTSFHNDTILNLTYKTEAVNLHKLFGVGAEFIQFEKLIKLLIKIKITPIYSIIRKLWNVYCQKYRICKNIRWSDIFSKAFKKII